MEKNVKRCILNVDGYNTGEKFGNDNNFQE